MATLNDYKLLENKCIKYFDMTNIATIHNEYTSNLTPKEKARYGFYYFIIQCLTDISELDDITDCICDQEFCGRFYKEPQQDAGIDAVCFDEENRSIHIFNFKYRKKFNSDKEQSENETWASSKFFSCILTERMEGLSDRMKALAKKVLDKYESNEIWQTHFYIISNENKELSTNDLVISQMKETYDLQIHAMGLNQIAPFLSSNHRQINATLIMPTDAVMSFEELGLSSEKSYIVRMPLAELIRITCNDPELRADYNIEDYSSLQSAILDYEVLYDNVRGYVLNSKYNSNIAKTLEKEPSKFFLYNNGLTIVAQHINSTPVNGNKRWKLEILNFQVLNGGQTLRTIHNFNIENNAHLLNNIAKAEVLVRVLNVTDPNLKNCIAEYTNSQNAIDYIDLKSLRKEQIDLETMFADENILYTRKKGLTDLTLDNARFQIGIQRLGQILMSTVRKRPEESSNKKREIFSTYYDELFTNNENLISKELVNTVETYHGLKSEFRRYNRQYTEQKAMYILYMLKEKPTYSVQQAIEILDGRIEAYKKDHNLDVALSRILIRSSFRTELEQYMHDN